MILKSNIIYINTQVETSTDRAVYSFNIDNGEKKFLYNSGSACKTLALSPRGHYLASINKSNLYVYTFSTSTLAKYTHVRGLTCLAFHPFDPYIATGAVDGQVVLWYGFASQSASQVHNSTLHWHSNTLASLAFSDDGAYLLTAGKESVLVCWQLDTGHKQFLPRLGAPIFHISIGCKGCMYALCCEDNSIKLINAVSSRLERNIRGLLTTVSNINNLNEVTASSGHSGFVINPATQELITSTASTLQFYNVYKDVHIREFNIAPRNKIIAVDSQNPFITVAECIAFSNCGKWLATVEQRHKLLESKEDDEDEDEIKHSSIDSLVLKFWVLEKESWNLSSRIDLPHKSSITSLTFHPLKSDLILTTSLDCTFKVWARSNIVSVKSEKMYSWSCQSLGSFRNESLSSGAFSEDGSVIALTSNSVFFCSLYIFN